MAVLGDDQLDAIAFTGGIGENSAHVRELALGHPKIIRHQIRQRTQPACSLW